MDNAHELGAEIAQTEALLHDEVCRRYRDREVYRYRFTGFIGRPRKLHFDSARFRDHPCLRRRMEVMGVRGVSPCVNEE